MSDERERLLKEADIGARAEMVKAEVGEILDELTEDAFETIRISDGGDQEGRENCYMQIRAIDLLRGKLIAKIENAKLARTELSKLTPESEEDDAT